jgi:hypothetical protein
MTVVSIEDEKKLKNKQIFFVTLAIERVRQGDYWRLMVHSWEI